MRTPDPVDIYHRLLAAVGGYQDIGICTCFHTADKHVKNTGRCQGDDSYGVRCTCPAYERDPNGDDVFAGDD